MRNQWHQNVLGCVGFLFLATSCRSNGSESGQRIEPLASAPGMPRKNGTEQTFGPGDKSDEPAFPSESGSPLRPGPTIQFQPSDLTSAIEKSPLRVGVDNLGAPIGIELLNALAAAIHLYEWPEMREVKFSFTVNDVTGGTRAADGYPKTDQAYVEIIPAAPLDDRWYAMTVSSLPTGISAPRLAWHETLPDGTLGVRFSPGSHPTLAAVRVCDKGDGNTVVLADFSERVSSGGAGSRAFGLGLANLAGGPEPTCVFDAASGLGGGARFHRATCKGLALDKVPIKISVEANLASVSGRSLESPGQGPRGIDQVISSANLRNWGSGCRIVRL